MPFNFSRYIVVALTLLFGMNAIAQNKWSLGLNYGVTFSNVRGNEVARDNNYALDYLIGGTADYHFKENFSLKMDLIFERNTFKNKIDATESQDPRILGRDLKTTLKYLTVPIMLQYKFGTQKNFFVNGGPYMALLLGSKQRIAGNRVVGKNNGNFSTTDFGLTFGAGTILELSDYNWLLIELRHNYGLSNINKVDAIGDGSVKTKAFNLIVTWEIFL